MTGPRIENRTREGIVVGGAPLDAAVAAGPAERALTGLRTATVTIERAEAALADLEDAVRRLPEALAAARAPLVRELRSAIASARREAIAPGRSQRRPGSWLAGVVTRAVGRHHDGADIPRVAAALTDAPGAVRHLAGLSVNRLEQELRARGLSENVTAQVIDEVTTRLGRSFHDAVRSQARSELRASERSLDDAARGAGPEFEQVERQLWGAEGRGLVERIRLVAPEHAATLSGLLDQAMRDPQRRQDLRAQARGPLALGLGALADRVREYRQDVERGEEGRAERFGDAYRAFPRVARQLALGLGFDLEGTTDKRQSVTARAARLHRSASTEEHEDARRWGILAVKIGLKIANIPIPGAVIPLVDQYMTLLRDEERAAAGVGDASALPERRARLAAAGARALGEEVIESLLTDPLTELSDAGIAELDPIRDADSRPMNAIRNFNPDAYEAFGQRLARFIHWIARQHLDEQRDQTLDAFEDLAEGRVDRDR